MPSASISSTSSRFPVILALTAGDGKGGRLLDGLIRWRDAHDPWRIVHFDCPPGDPRLRRWARNAGGVIAQTWSPEMRAWLRHSKLPTVGVHQEPDAASPDPWPVVTEDEEGKARVAVEHLLGANPASLYYMDLPFNPVPSRRKAMLEAIAAAGRPGGLLKTEAGGGRELVRLAAKVAALPRPVGLVVFSIRQSIFLLEACERAGLRVPEDVRVLTCGASPREASLPCPALSSVEADEERIGYLAAGLLRRVRAGEDLGGEVIRVPPAGVTRRLSTDPLGTDDQAVLRALRHMRLGLAEGASPRLPEIARVAGLSPRGLQERFRKALGCSVSQEWLEMRVTC